MTCSCVRLAQTYVRLDPGRYRHLAYKGCEFWVGHILELVSCA